MNIKEWEERAYRGTSGDMVHDILTDWKNRETELLSRLEEGERAIKAIKDIHSMTCIGEGASCWKEFNEITDFVCEYLGYKTGESERKEIIK